MKKLLKESGLREINALADRYKKAKIYFHQDLDGVTTALAMKKYLEDNGIKVVDSEVIQYGDKEFAVKKIDAQGDIMPVLVDFAHGKPMFFIHTDHHDRQAGAGDIQSKSFKGARSNVETISQVVSPKDIFPSTDIKLISTVDSADFAKYGLKPENIMNYIYKLDKDKDATQNKFALGLVTNKLLLAYKNKPGFLETLVMTSEPSLLNIYQNIRQLAEKNRWATPVDMLKNQKDYIKSQKESRFVKYQDGIIVQYGGGNMRKPGSYDRYTPFENYPDADFLVIAWPLGLVQASCNPFKQERGLKGVNLGDIAQEVLQIWEGQLKEKIVPLSTIKWVSELSSKEGSVGFTGKDLDAFYGDKLKTTINSERLLEKINQIMDIPFQQLTEPQRQLLDKFGVSVWDLVQANSGGHKCITNISGLNYLGRKTRPNDDDFRYNPDSDEAPYVKFAKMVQSKFVEKLKEKLNQ